MTTLNTYFRPNECELKRKDDVEVESIPGVYEIRDTARRLVLTSIDTQSKWKSQIFWYFLDRRSRHFESLSKIGLSRCIWRVSNVTRRWDRMLPRRRFCHSQRQQRGTTRFIVTSECERSNDIMLRTMKNLADIDILGCVIVGDAERSGKTVVKKGVNGTSGDHRCRCTQ